MTKEQWESVLKTIDENESLGYPAPDDETEFWKEAEKADRALNDLKLIHGRQNPRSR